MTAKKLTEYHYFMLSGAGYPVKQRCIMTAAHSLTYIIRALYIYFQIFDRLFNVLNSRSPYGREFKAPISYRIWEKS